MQYRAENLKFRRDSYSNTRCLILATILSIDHYSSSIRSELQIFLHLTRHLKEEV